MPKVDGPGIIQDAIKAAALAPPESSSYPQVARHEDHRPKLHCGIASFASLSRPQSCSVKPSHWRRCCLAPAQYWLLCACEPPVQEPRPAKYSRRSHETFVGQLTQQLFFCLASGGIRYTAPSKWSAVVDRVMTAVVRENPRTASVRSAGRWPAASRPSPADS